MTMTDKIKSFTKKELGIAYVQMNTWQWPELLSDYCPAGWDQMDHRQKMTHGQDAWVRIHQLTTNYERSLAWWTIELKKTYEEHWKWYYHGRSDCMREMDQQTDMAILGKKTQP